MAKFRVHYTKTRSGFSYKMDKWAATPESAARKVKAENAGEIEITKVKER